MAAASTDVNFKEELSAIEQCELILDPPDFFSVCGGAHRGCARDRVQGSIRSRAHSRSIQSSTTFYPSPNQIFHHRAATDGQIRSDDGTSQSRHGRYVLIISEQPTEG